MFVGEERSCRSHEERVQRIFLGVVLKRGGERVLGRDSGEETKDELGREGVLG